MMMYQGNDDSDYRRKRIENDNETQMLREN